jgi:UTP-glucose-1-phosphate uridylyltransferase
VLQACAAVGDEAFAVMLPDDIFNCPRPCLCQLLDLAETRDAPVVALLKVARSEISRNYTAFACHARAQIAHARLDIDRFSEMSEIREMPSNRANAQDEAAAAAAKSKITFPLATAVGFQLQPPR